MRGLSYCTTIPYSGTLSFSLETARSGGDELAAGTQVGRHRVRRRVAAGGFGCVYLAEPEGGGAPVALKVLHAALARSKAMVERFAAEARCLERVRHANIVGLEDSGFLPDGRPFLVLEWVEGEDLAQRIWRLRRLSPLEALSLLSPVCAALEAAHAAGIIHRDVTPANVLIADAGMVKLADFGIAKWMDFDDLPFSSGLRLGTPAAMAPEQIRGQPVDVRTDVYALGVLLHLLITGRAPFCGAHSEIELMHLKSPVPRPSLLAPVRAALDAVVLTAMAKEPCARFASAAAFLRALVRAVHQ